MMIQFILNNQINHNLQNKCQIKNMKIMYLVVIEYILNIIICNHFQN